MTLEAIALLFATAVQTYNLPVGLLESICFEESHYDIQAFNPDDGTSGSHGICQVQLPTAKFIGFRGTQAELKQAKTNIDYAGRYLSSQLRRYRGDVRKAVAAYNAGSYVERNGKCINQGYINKVMRTWGTNEFTKIKKLPKVHKRKGRGLPNKAGKARTGPGS